MVETQCERVRMLYRDCARPPPPPLQTDRRQVGVDICFSFFFFFLDSDWPKTSPHVKYIFYFLIAFYVLVLLAKGDHLVSIQSVPSGPCMPVLIPSHFGHILG